MGWLRGAKEAFVAFEDTQDESKGPMLEVWLSA